MKGKILFEGRYDSMTRQISNDVIEYIFKTEGIIDDPQYFSLPFEKNGKDSYMGPNLMVSVELVVNRVNGEIEYGNSKVPYHINTYIDEDDYIVIEITIDESYGRRYNEEIFYKINEDVRHELEHFLQNIFSDREQPYIENTSDYKTTFEHHMDPSEVEALVHGFYRRAKLEKKPLDVVMMDDLNREISLGNITEEDADELLKTWVIYARRRLPDAIYSF